MVSLEKGYRLCRTPADNYVICVTIVGSNVGSKHTDYAMLTVRDAAKNALNFYREIYPEINGELIEEIEFDTDHNYWLITLSFPSGGYQPQSISDVLRPPKVERKYKTFQVDAENGKVLSMKIRTLENDRS